MELRGEQKGFGPVFSPGSRALILGSYPSPKSFSANFYYGHPQNRFWPLLAALFGTETPRTVTQKTALVLQNNLALWDSLESCRILGAADTSITAPVPNDVAGLLQSTGIRHVFCNGEASYRYYRKFNEKAAGVQAVRLPSTSPANAACSFEKLLAAWRPVAEAAGGAVQT